MCNPFTWKRGIGIAALLSWGIISADAQDLCPVADSPFERIRLAGAVPTDRPELAVQQLSCAYNESLSGGHAVIASAAAYLLGKAYETQGDNQFALRQYENGLQALTGSGRTAAVSVEELLIRIEGSAKGIPSSTGTSGAMDLYRGDVGDIEAWFGEFPETRAGTMSLALTTNAGNMYLLQSQHAQAKDYFQQALNTAQLLDDQLAIVGISSNLAWNAIRNERYEDAKTHLDRALQNAPADHRTALRRALLAVGVNTREQRRPDAALSSIQESIDLYREAGDRNGLAGALAHLGTTYHVLENYPAAEIAYLEAGFLNRSRGDNAIARHINGGLALTYHAMGDLERAQHRYEMYFIALDEFLTSFGTDEGRVGILENQQALFRDFVDVALQVAQDSGDYTVARRAAERGRAPVLPDLMRSKQGAPQRQPGFVPAGQFLLGEDLDHVLHGLGGETDMAANPMQMAISVPVQTAPGIPVGDSRLPGEPFPPDGGDAVPPTGAPEVDQPILPRVEPPTFLEYYVTDQRTLVSLIRPDGSLTGAVIDIGSTALAAVIDDFLVAMNVASPRGVEVRGVTPVTGPRAVDAANIDELALRLHDLLIKPIENDLPVDPADHVVIVPHGALWRLPFATLRDGQGAYVERRLDVDGGQTPQGRPPTTAGLDRRQPGDALRIRTVQR
jgi:tetratricopeptide (TPR) repeat protein